MRLTNPRPVWGIILSSLPLLFSTCLDKLQAQPAQSPYNDGDPSNSEQFILELINQARIDPTGEGGFLDSVNTQYSRSALDMENQNPPSVWHSTNLQKKTYAAPLSFSLVRCCTVATIPTTVEK